MSPAFRRCLVAAVGVVVMLAVPRHAFAQG